MKAMCNYPSCTMKQFSKMKGHCREFSPGITLLLICLMASGCSIFPRTQEARVFGVEVRRPASPATGSAVDPAAEGPIIEVAPFSVSHPFHNSAFHVRVSESEWKEDYYNRLTTTPDVVATQLLRAWLQDSDPGMKVSLPMTEVRPDFIVHGNIEEFYVDARMRESPSAVIRIDLQISSTGGPDGSQVVWNRSYQHRSTLPDMFPESVVNGWQACLEKAFASMEADLLRVLALNQITE